MAGGNRAGIWDPHDHPQVGARLFLPTGREEASIGLTSTHSDHSKVYLWTVIIIQTTFPVVSFIIFRSASSKHKISE